MVYYRIPFTPGGTFTYPPGCILARSYYSTGYMMCEFQSVTTVVSGWEEIDGNTFESACPGVKPPITLSPTHEVIAVSAALEAGEIVITLREGVTVETGTILKFRAPCDCTEANAGLTINGDTYYIVDARGNSLEGTEYGGFWSAGSMLAVLLDSERNMAFLQNAGTSYDCITVELAEQAAVTSTNGSVGLTSFKKSTALGVVFFYIQLTNTDIRTDAETVTVRGIDLPYMGNVWQCTANEFIEVVDITSLSGKYTISIKAADSTGYTGPVWLRGWYMIE